MKIAVFGARQGSLGYHVEWAGLHRGHTVRTYGPTNEEVHYRFGETTQHWQNDLCQFNPDAVVCTIGVNIPVPVAQKVSEEIPSHIAYHFGEAMRSSFEVNVMAPLEVLRTTLALGSGVHSFAAVSSNSAQIARRGSVAYCSSKAALSMAIRCAARETEGSPLVYAYEFGLLRGTPMTRQTERTFGPAQTRIPGAPDGLPVENAADVILSNLENPGQHLNGALLRMDGGEQ